MASDVLGKTIERRFDQIVVGDCCRARIEAHKPSGALGIVGKQAMNIGTENAPLRLLHRQDTQTAARGQDLR